MVLESSAPRPGPGRPPSGARERVLSGGLEVLKRDGYAGLTTAKVAAASGQSKALIGYHFGSKQGLVAAVARDVAAQITREVLDRLGSPDTPAELVEGAVDGIWRVLDRDEGLARVYFDLAAQAAVDAPAREIMAEMKAGFREVLVDLLAGLDNPPPPRRRLALAVVLVAGIEGLALERLDRGQTRELEQARGMWVEAAAGAVDPDREGRG